MTSGPAPTEVPKAGFIGMGALACLLFLDLGTATVVPWWVTLGLVLLWLVLFAQAVRWFTPYPGRVPWLAAAGTLVWCATVAGGGALGWWA